MENSVDTVNRKSSAGPRLVAVFVTVLLGIAASPLRASPACGSTVTGHVVFDSDVNCVNSNGLTVGADGTTIDLAGFMLTCTAAAGYFGSCQGQGDVGIDTNGFSDILIKGPGTIDGFAVGVHVNAGADVNVRELTVTGPASPGAGSNSRPEATGIEVEGTICPTPAVTIINVHGNDVSNHREGIELVNAHCVNVGHNHAHDNNSDPTECHGVLAVDSGDNNFNNNLIDRNGENLGIDGGLTFKGASSANNTVTNNDVSNNCGDGISVRFGGNNNQVVNNEARNNSTSTLGTQCFGPPPPGVFFDLAARSAGAGNMWNKNNKCNTQSAGIPPGVCNPGE